MLLRNEDGWFGLFTRAEHLGAYRNGTRVVKVAKDTDDRRDIGATGRVLGSLGHPQIGVAYFVEWDDMPRHAVAVVAWKIASMEKQ